MLLINHQPEGIVKALLQAWVRISHRLQALVAAREADFLLFVGRAGANHAYDRDQPIDIVHIAHAAEVHHGGALDMMNGARAPTRDHLPNGGIGPDLLLGRQHICRERHKHTLPRRPIFVNAPAKVRCPRFRITEALGGDAVFTLPCRRKQLECFPRGN